MKSKNPISPISKSKFLSTIAYTEYDPCRLNFRESILCLGNTRMGLRGIEDERPLGSSPGLYLAGIFNKSESLVSEIVNLPDILSTYPRLNGAKVSADACRVKDYVRELDLEKGCLRRSVVFETAEGKQLKVESLRFLSFADKTCGALKVTATPLNFSGPFEMTTEFDATLVSRQGSYAYDETVKHYHLVKANDQFEEDLYARVRLRDSGILVDFASWFNCLNAPFKRRRRLYSEKLVETLSLEAQKGRCLELVKYFTIVDSRDLRPETMRLECLNRLGRMKTNGFEEEFRRSEQVLKSIWEKCDVKIEGDDDSDLQLRFNTYNLIVLGNEDSSRYSIGAKGLSTEMYGGHYFWDTEIYLVPFYLNTQPQVARNLLEFRCRTLQAARQRAAQQGLEGCLWPWESDAEGNEGIRQTVLEDGSVVRRTTLDQYHIVTDVAFAALRYLQHTGDEYYFRLNLSRLVVEGMRFWRSFALACNPKDAKVLHLRNVMGPDEYHEKIDDNYYTNHMTRLVFAEFFKYFDVADSRQKSDLLQVNGLKPEEVEELRRLGQKIYLPEPRDNVIEQFDGYFKMRDLRITEHSPDDMPVYPDPEIGKGMEITERQEALMRDVTTTQLIKQADAVLTYCLDPEGFSREVIQATFDYYQDRTLQFSSLSPGVCAWAGVIAGRDETAFKMFKLGVTVDLKDQRKETHTGLHTACHGGAYLAVTAGFAGVRSSDKALLIAPSLPKAWKAVAFPVCYRGVKLDIRVEKKKVKVQALSPGQVTVRCKGQDIVVDMEGNALVEIDL